MKERGLEWFLSVFICVHLWCFLAWSGLDKCFQLLTWQFQPFSMWSLLRRQGGDAYSRYGALLRELVSFEQALDRRSRGQASS